MQMYDCEKFEGCSTPVCPLWKPVNKQKTIKGEELCIYLLEYQKEVLRDEIFKGAYPEKILKDMAMATKGIFARPNAPAHLINALKRASTTGSRILAGRKLNG